MMAASCRNLILSSSVIFGFSVFTATSIVPVDSCHSPLFTVPNCPAPKCSTILCERTDYTVTIVYSSSHIGIWIVSYVYMAYQVLEKGWARRRGRGRVREGGSERGREGRRGREENGVWKRKKRRRGGQGEGGREREKEEGEEEDKREEAEPLVINFLSNLTPGHMTLDPSLLKYDWSITTCEVALDPGSVTHCIWRLTISRYLFLASWS